MDAAAAPVSSELASAEYSTSGALWQASALVVQEQDSLVASVYEILWKQIVEGDRQPGERMVVSELARELDVSRTPVQSALYQLQQAGMVHASAGRGFHVMIFSATDIRDLYNLRTILEVAAVRAAVAQIPALELHAALETITALRQVPLHEAAAYFLRSDVVFHHEMIAGHCGNRRLMEAIAHQRARMGLFMVSGTRLPDGIASALDEHEIIAHALLERAAERAAAAMEQHIQRVKEDALRQYAAVRPPRVRRLRVANDGP